MHQYNILVGVELLLAILYK